MINAVAVPELMISSGATVTPSCVSLAAYCVGVRPELLVAILNGIGRAEEADERSQPADRVVAVVEYAVHVDDEVGDVV